MGSSQTFWKRLTDLSDVEIGTPEDGQILSFNATSGDWEPTDTETLSNYLTGVVITDNTLDSLKLSINEGDDTLVDIAPGRCMFVDDYSDPENVVITIKDYVGGTYDHGITGRSAFIYLELVGNTLVPGKMEEFDLAAMRDKVILGRPFNSDTGEGPSMTNIAYVRVPVNGASHISRETALGRGSFKISGGLLTPSTGAGNELKMDKSEITSFRPFVLAGTTPSNPSVVVDAAQTNISSYAYHLQGSSTTTIETDIDPANYDLNGVKTSCDPNNWTCQRVYYFPKSQTFHIVYGQRQYGSVTTCYNDILRNAVLNEGILFGSELVGYLLLKNVATTLGDTGVAIIINHRNT